MDSGGREKEISRSYRYMTGVHGINLSSLPGGLFSAFLFLFFFFASLHMPPLHFLVCEQKLWVFRKADRHVMRQPLRTERTHQCL